MSVTVAQVRPRFLPEQRLPVGEMMPSVPAPAHPSWTGPPLGEPLSAVTSWGQGRGVHTPPWVTTFMYGRIMCRSMRCSCSPMMTVRHKRPLAALPSSAALSPNRSALSPGMFLAVATGVSSAVGGVNPAWIQPSPHEG